MCFASLKRCPSPGSLRSSGFNDESSHSSKLRLSSPMAAIRPRVCGGAIET